MKKRLFVGCSLFFLMLFIVVNGKRSLASEVIICTEQSNSEISEVLFGLLDSDEKDYLEYSISNPFFIEGSNVEDNRMYFVFSQEKCIGELVYSPALHAASFFREQCETITELKELSESLWVACDGKENVFIVTRDKYTLLWGPGVDEKNVSLIRNSNCNYQEIVLVDVKRTTCLGREEPQRYIDESHYLNVPIKANAANPDISGVGLCWVASILSMIEYNKNYSTGYTTLGFYYLIKDYVHSSHGQTIPTASEEYIVGAFSLFDILVNYSANGLSYSSVKSLIDLNKPILANITTTSYSPEHSVVVCGYHKFSQAGLYIYLSYRMMDPNCTNYVTGGVSGTDTNFTYNYGSVCYSVWMSNYKW